jgi:hypothetical protein
MTIIILDVCNDRFGAGINVKGSILRHTFGTPIKENTERVLMVVTVLV